MEVIVRVECNMAVIEVKGANLTVTCRLDELVDVLVAVQKYAGNPY